MKKQFGDYYLGLDIGTNTVGWAVTDLNYNVLKFNQKAMWGVRKFNEAQTAAERRGFRTDRRRLARRKERLLLLREIFRNEIEKVDPEFFLRLNESKYYLEDRSEINLQSNNLFNETNFSDKEFHEEYPTIFHLRKELMESDEPHDIRLVFLALSNIMKYRGHFLFPGKDISVDSNIDELFESIKDYFSLNFSIELNVPIHKVKEILINKKSTNSSKKKEILELFDKDVLKENKKQIDALFTLMTGGTTRFDVLFDDEDLKEIDTNKVAFSTSKFDESIDQIEQDLDDRFVLVSYVKSIYDWSILATLLNDSDSISEAKVKAYEQHAKDLELLKRVVKSNKNLYKEMFLSPDITGNYTSYVGDVNINGIRKQTKEKCSKDDFYKFVKKTIDNLEENAEILEIRKKIELDSFMPKQRISNNGVIPFQLHYADLKKILGKVSKYLPFLNEVDNQYNKTNVEKIKELFTFRIPYYVGPLNGIKEGDDKSNYWAVRKSNKKITPWNFYDVIDEAASAENFITRMTNDCTYLLGEVVAPKNSLIYSEFMVLNEINNLKINNEPITVELKTKIVNELFKKSKRVTQKALRSFLIKENVCDQDVELSGFDGDFKANLGPYIEIEKILGDKVHKTEMVENIIRWITLFGDSQDLLKRKIKEEYSELSDKELSGLVRLKFAGWGRLSTKFLKEIPGESFETGEYFSSIIEALRNTNENLMKLLSNRYSFVKSVQIHNMELSPSVNLEYDDVDNLRISPSVKRQVWQSLQIVKELVKITGHNPKKVFVEMAKGPEEEKKRTVSRRLRLMELYRALKSEERDWVSEIESHGDKKFLSDRLYLYYTQKGRCMYSGQKIDLSSLYDSNIYDIDHIFPQSLTKDDSLNNRCLVLKSINIQKTDKYPIDVTIRSKQYSMWKNLYNSKLIEKTKFDRLVRNTELTTSELADFIARQVVETRQVTKVVADVISRALDQTDVVYVKAKNVSMFRQEYDFVKVREINDFHHAKDAYLNIVVGNVYDTKFTKNIFNYLKEKPTYSLNQMFNFDVKRNGVTAWIRGKEGTIQTVKRQMSKNNILVTEYAYEEKGEFFKQQIKRKGLGQFPIKTSDYRLNNIKKYGGYNKIAGSFFSLIRYQDKKKVVKQIVHIPVLFNQGLGASVEDIKGYLDSQNFGTNLEILIPKIKMKTLFSINGFLCTLTGRQGAQLIYNNANQLVVPEEIEKYCKKIVRVITKFSELKEKEKIALSFEYDKVSKDKNLELFDLLTDKLVTQIYSKKMLNDGNKLVNGRDHFIELSINEQVIVLNEILKITQCNSVIGKLNLIKQKDSIRILSNTSVNPDWNMEIIHQSVTGLFEKRIKINDL